MPYAVLNEPANKKLGNVPSLSRPVGPSCPSDCRFLHNGCYAERIQARRPAVAKNWATRAYGLSAAQWRQWSGALASDLLRADARNVRAVRLHVAGDWLSEGRLDRPYLAATFRALRAARQGGAKVRLWYYTHAPRVLGPRRRDRLRALGCEGFASVHEPEEARALAAIGWRLAIDCPEPIKTAKPGFREILGTRALVCPEQAKGVTCDDCGYCFRDTKQRHVTFLRH